MSAIESWGRRVEAHHAQSLAVQELNSQGEDFWRPYASAFRADPARDDDPVANRLMREVDRNSTVLDVGGGAGRLALPLALRCKHVTVVDPSSSMLDQLRAAIGENEIDNVSIVETTWEEAAAPVADVVLCAHVLYGVADVVPFIRKLESHARRSILVVSFFDAPQSHLGPLWKAVHRQDRIDLPALSELMEVLWEMDIYPGVEMFQAGPPQLFDTHEDAVQQLGPRLYVAAGTDRERRLRRAVKDLLVQTPDGLALKGARPRRMGLLKWST